MPFTEEAIARGIVYETVSHGGPGCGVALVDLDGDGDPDLVSTGDPDDGVLGLFENDGHGFFRARHGRDTVQELAASSVIAADYDADGDLDLYVACYPGANLLLRNDGDFRFTDVAAQAGVADTGNGSGCAFGDVDGDGFVDLYVANHSDATQPFSNPMPCRLYLNRGDGTFMDVAPAFGLDLIEQVFQVVFFDYDGDSDPDLYVSIDKCLGPGPGSNKLFENRGGSFADVSAETGTGLCIDSMGVAVGDFDGNRFLDLYATNTPEGNPLLLNRGTGSFVDVAEAAGVSSHQLGWGALFLDYDNSGTLDLFVCNMTAPDRLFHNDGHWPLSDIASLVGVAGTTSSYASAMADVDDDGDVDFLVQPELDRLRLFVNHEGERRNWAKFDVVPQGANRSTVGTSVHVRVGMRWQIRELACGSSYLSQNEHRLHFGLDGAETIDEVKVIWPDGEVRRLRDLAARTTWALVPNDKLGDADGNGSVDLRDFVVLASCFDPSGEPTLEPGYEAMDFDGDGGVDWDDFRRFQARYVGQRDDCDANGVLDLVEILRAPALDTDHDGILDRCE